MQTIRRLTLLTILLTLGALGGTASARDKIPNEARFLHRAMSFAGESLDRSWGKYQYARGHDPKAPAKHEGPWVEASNAIIQPLVSTNDIALVTWHGTTKEGIDYYLAMRITIAGPPPTDGTDDIAGNMEALTADTWWKDGARPARETNPDDSRFIPRAIKAAEHDLVDALKYNTHDDKSVPKHDGAWLDPAKATIQRYPSDKAKANVTWEGTTKEGIRYSVFIRCDLDRVGPVPTDGKPDDNGGYALREVADAMWGPIPKGR